MTGGAVNAAAQAATKVAAEAVKRKNLFDILFQYQNFGIGLKLTRSLWHRPDCHWTITRVIPTSQVFLSEFGDCTLMIMHCTGPFQTRKSVGYLYMERKGACEQGTTNYINMQEGLAPV